VETHDDAEAEVGGVDAEVAMLVSERDEFLLLLSGGRKRRGRRRWR
jgi:hypothetical protein